MTRARDLARLGNSQAFTVDANNNIGIGSTTPNAKLDVGGGLSVGVATVGSAVTITSSGINAAGVITARSGIQGIGIQSAGTNITTGIITALNFIGTGNTFAVVGNRVDISIAGGTGSSGVVIRDEGTAVGSAITSINFVGSAVVATASGAGSTITISGGIGTEALVASGIVTTLSLSSSQDHKVTATGITTITVSGGKEGDSHTVRIVNSGIATVGFSTYFLFPSGSPPVLPTTSGAISLLSFTVHRVGTAGTQLLAGASLNFS
mgnify:CR=1 FL=1